MQQTTGFESTIFTLAHTNIGSMPFNNQGRTLRFTVAVNVEVEGLRLKLSNRCGSERLRVGAVTLAACDGEGTLLPGTHHTVTAGSEDDFLLEPGEERWSDDVPITLAPGGHFAVSLYYPENTRVQSGNWLGKTAQRSRPGSFCSEPHLPAPNLVSRFARTVVTSDITVTLTTVSEIVARCPGPVRTLACFGDSITQQCNWTAPLARLLQRLYPGEISLCNLGISGNRLLADSPPVMGGFAGQAGIHRFEREVLAMSGLTYVLLELGTNDIGQPGTYGIPEEDVITLEAYVEGMTSLAGKLRERGVKAYAATLAPRPITSVYTLEREALRQEMNAWIRTTACFDAVIDFDAALRRRDGKPGMRDGFAIPDGLHPSPYGGLWMAKCIDLALFGGNGHE